MAWFVTAVLAYLRAFLLPRHELGLEVIALRQQLGVFERKQARPKLHRLDRFFWVALRGLWSGWADALIIVQPETVICWHRAGFRLFWRWRSRSRGPGRPTITFEIRQLIRRMKADNPSWGAPRIHGELLMLGLDISEPTVSRYLKRQHSGPRSSDPEQTPSVVQVGCQLFVISSCFPTPDQLVEGT